jgi:cysteine-dependent adenosine diphosphate thiazole synthase
MRCLDMNRAEPAIVNGTCAGLPRRPHHVWFVSPWTGVELSDHDGSNRMGPTFGAMMASGIKAAKVVIRIHETARIVDGKIMG